ncbi:MAG: LysE family translocator, partial [Pseudomonadota bacterium]
MILDPTLTAAYLVVALTVALSPGPDVLFVLANSMQHKMRGAVASALGIGAGSLLHAFAAAVGISALIAASPTAFDVLRYAGAAYLAYLGFQALRSWYHGAGPAGSAGQVTETSALRVFQRALVTNILNPKVIVFYLALLPQFVSEALGHVGLQIFLLGAMHA